MHIGRAIIAKEKTSAISKSTGNSGNIRAAGSISNEIVLIMSDLGTYKVSAGSQRDTVYHEFLSKKTEVKNEEQRLRVENANKEFNKRQYERFKSKVNNYKK